MRSAALLAFLCLCVSSSAQTVQTPSPDSSGKTVKKTSSTKRSVKAKKKSTSTAANAAYDPSDPLAPQGYAAPEPMSYPPTGIIGYEKPKSGLEFQWVPGYMLQAPEPGHPLNPNDVLILTGKDKQQRQPGYGQQTMYYGGSSGAYGAAGYYGAPGYYGPPSSKNPIPILSGSPTYYGAPGYAYPTSGSILGGGDVVNFPVFNSNVLTPGAPAVFDPFSPFGTFGSFGAPPGVLFGPGVRPFNPWIGIGPRF